MPELKPGSPERGLPTPEVAAETQELGSPEQRPSVQPKPAAEAPLAFRAPAPVATPPAARTLTPLQQAVEDVLAEGLDDLYRSLTPAEQEVFKLKGEATAIQLGELLGQVKVKLAEVLKLIRDWLRTIPGLSRYFVEQTAKIKADRVLKIH